MAQLVKLLERVNDSSVKDNAFEIFKEIATELMSKFAIKTPNHPDLSVYPRRSKAGNWFLHPSGVDITLER